MSVHCTRYYSIYLFALPEHFNMCSPLLYKSKLIVAGPELHSILLWKHNSIVSHRLCCLLCGIGYDLAIFYSMWLSCLADRMIPSKHTLSKLA